MKFSELKVNPKHQFVEMAKAALPGLGDALLQDYESVHKEILEMMEADMDIPEADLQQFRTANHNYFLYFFYGAYKLLDPAGKTNEAWRKAQMAQANEAIKTIGQTFNPNNKEESNDKPDS